MQGDEFPAFGYIDADIIRQFVIAILSANTASSLTAAPSLKRTRS